MIPNITTPTDNIYKFVSVFGLVIFITSIYWYFSVYSSSLEKKVKYITDIQLIELKKEKNLPISLQETVLFEKSQDLLKITKSNENFMFKVIGGISGLSIFLCFFGVRTWYSKTQQINDEITNFQKEKAIKELRKLDLEISILEKQLSPVSSKNND